MKCCIVVISHLFEIPLVHNLKKKIKLLHSIGILICSNKLEKTYMKTVIKYGYFSVKEVILSTYRLGSVLNSCYWY